MKKAIHIVQIGCGQWGKNILRDLKTLGCKVTVVARSNDSIKRAQEFKADKIVKKLNRIANVDGYIVATPTSTHGKTILNILKISKNAFIFTEKPLCINLKEAEEIKKNSNNNVFVMDKWRYHQGVLEIAKIAKQKKLGKIIGLKTTRRWWGNPHDDTDSIWHLAPHDLSISQEILGKIFKPKYAVADFANGKPIGIVALLGDKPWHMIEVSSRYKEKKREVILFCEKGVVSLDDGYSKYIDLILTQRLVKYEKPKVKKIKIKFAMPLYDELDTFIKFIKKQGPPPKSNLSEGIETIKNLSEIRKLAGI